MAMMGHLRRWSVALGVGVALAGTGGAGPIRARVAKAPKTFCNPVNLNYRFMLVRSGVREAADPVVVPYRDAYLLFASKSSGYWHTKDFRAWTYVEIPPSVLPIEAYAPAVLVDKGAVYYVGSAPLKATLYRSEDPFGGKWEPVGTLDSETDPAFFLEDGRLHVYCGSSSRSPVRARTYAWPALK